MRCPFSISLISLALLAAVNPARADGAAIARDGNDRGVPACMSCHGAHGEGMPANGYPRLAGLNAAYLKTQLEAFANGQRANAMMAPIAQTLNADDRAAVANYYAALNNPPEPKKNVPPADSAGARLATQGRWSKNLPACTQCHGAMGVGVGASFPALAGQSSLYIENQLRAWQQGTRAPGPLGLMKVIASKLSAADIRALAEYFSSLPANNPARGSPP